MKGAILEHYQAKGETVYSATYSAMLKDKLNPAICKKRKTVLLYHDNARPHVVAATFETFQNLRFKVLPHPPYSPDLTPCDFHVFGPLKEALCGCCFDRNEEVKEEVHKWITEQPQTFFSNGITKLVDHYKKCIKLQADYVET